MSDQQIETLYYEELRGGGAKGRGRFEVRA